MTKRPKRRIQHENDLQAARDKAGLLSARMIDPAHDLTIAGLAEAP